MKNISLRQQTTDRLYTMIVVEQHLTPGGKLPNELLLSQDLGVSRTTLREAIRTLTAQGVLEVRRGKGTFVSERINEINDFGFSGLQHVRGQLRDLFELRQVFEPAAARLACQRATEEELREILTLGQGVEDCIQTGRNRTEADWAFHAAIVRATHNEFMTRLLPVIHQAVSGAVVAGGNEARLAKDTLQDHGMLMDFFRKRDAVGAEHAMAIHMLHSIDTLELEAHA